MTDDLTWILLDTETTGFARPVFAVDIAAQKMCGWEKDGKPFRRMLNHGCKISDEASRVHGYTREILERDGGLPMEVYEEFSVYAGGLPVVAYNLQYDWNQVLLLEWKRLGISTIGFPGFCALKLAQRLLDPVPAGNCKLQTLRQYYRLPENGAHTALGDVLTVVDLMQQVLRPLAEKRGLDTWEKIVGFAGDDWYPSRLAFGKFKGRLYQEAREDAELEAWLEWLAESTNGRSSAMGRWYLRQLHNGCGLEDAAFLDLQFQEAAVETPIAAGLLVFQHPEVELYQRLVEASRNRLAELELAYGIEKSKVDSVRSRLFAALRPFYQERDRLRLLVQFRKAFIERLLAEGEESAAATTGDYQREAAEKDREYDSTASALEGKRELNEEETVRLKQLWKKLVRMFHPDLHEHDPEKSGNFERLEGKVMAESWTAESFLKNDWSNWRWNIFTGKWLQCLVRRFFLPPNPMILLFMILPQSICLTQAINEACDEEKGRHRAVGTHRKGPAGVHSETRLGQCFARCFTRADGTAVAL